MSGTLHLLVYGALDSGVTDSLRIGCFVEPLAGLGVEVRSWQWFSDDVACGAGPATAAPAATSGDLLRDLGMTALAWADVVLFRRWHPTYIVCTACESSFARMVELVAHIRETGHHSVGPPDLVLRPIVELLTAHPELLGERGIVYDTDDDVLDYPDWTGLGPAAARERDLVLGILAIADVVTATTPVLAERLRRHTGGQVRVVRNAVDPAWYAGAPEEGLAGSVRVAYHGVARRLRDYQVARPAVDKVARSVPGVRRVWVGAAESPVAEAVDEVRPWVDGLAAFGASLVAARPDVGLAPLLDEPFNRAKSELHWIDYAMTGAPTIATGFGGPGPYDVIRDGADGLLARTPADWVRHLRRLAGSPALRAELAGRARERVLAEYTLQARAGEWADAYRRAATHGGYARAQARTAAVSAAAAVWPAAMASGAAVRL
jgi:glycosyltransferase involved in cell wall biosynthesis